MISFFGNIINSIQPCGIRTTPPNIVTTNLKLWFEATISSSYPCAGNIWYDISGNGNDLVFSARPSWEGNCFNFDGVNDLGTIQNITSVNSSGTVGYWFKLTDSLISNLPQRISGINSNWEFGRLDCALGEKTNGGFGGCTPLTVPNGSITADLGTHNSTLTNGLFSFTNTVWANLVFTWSIGGTAETYVNGQLLHTCSPVNTSRSGTWIVGTSHGNTSRYFKGRLASMVYYDVQLSGTQILQNFNETKSDYGY